MPFHDFHFMLRADFPNQVPHPSRHFPALRILIVRLDQKYRGQSVHSIGHATDHYLACKFFFYESQLFFTASIFGSRIRSDTL